MHSALKDLPEIHVSMVRQMGAYYSRLLSAEGLKLQLIFGNLAQSALPNKIWVPDLPDDAPKDLREQVLWVLYHEMAHLVFTDFESTSRLMKGGKIEEKYRTTLHSVLNIFEDVRIESLWNQKYPGTWSLAYNVHVLSFGARGKLAGPLNDPLQSLLWKLGALFIGRARGWWYESQGFDRLDFSADEETEKLYQEIFAPELDSVTLSLDREVMEAAALRVFHKIVEIMKTPPPEPPPPPPPPPEPPKKNIEVGDVCRLGKVYGVVEDKTDLEVLVREVSREEALSYLKGG